MFRQQLEFGLEGVSYTDFYKKYQPNRTIWQVCCAECEPQVSEKYKKNFDALTIRLPIKRAIKRLRFITIDNLQLEHDCKRFEAKPKRVGE